MCVCRYVFTAVRDLGLGLLGHRESHVYCFLGLPAVSWVAWLPFAMLPAGALVSPSSLMRVLCLLAIFVLSPAGWCGVVSCRFDLHLVFLVWF